MKRVILASAIFCLSMCVSAEPDVEKGKAKAGVCASCHGADGNSAAGTFPKLAGQHPKYTVKQLMDMKVPAEDGGRPVPEMTAFLTNLSAEDMADIAAFYAQQTIKGGATKKDLVAKGESVYRAGNQKTGVASCTGCHGPAGLGNKGAGFPAIAGQHAAYIEKQLKAFRTAANEPGAEGARANDGEEQYMRSVAGQMTDYEIRAVASYIEGLR